MKCQNCGKSEVSFHYSSNVNGCVTETHLCADCAAKSGYDLDSMLDSGGVFSPFMPSFYRQAASAGSLLGEFFPFVSLSPGFGAGFPAPVRLRLRTPSDDSECVCGGGCGKIAPDSTEADVDVEMSKRREVNMLREQMRIAAESDDFEKAIELREQIKGMEAGG